MPFDPVPLLSQELALPKAGVAAVLSLLAEGATVPFIARYRKELTGGMDEVPIRAIEERHGYLAELEKRREAVLASIEEQGKLTPALRAEVLACTTKAALEDLYLPFKPKRRTRATIAREKGLGPLAERLLAQPERGDPAREAVAFVRSGFVTGDVEDVDAALAGARDIAAEVIAETAAVRAFVRDVTARFGEVTSHRAKKAPAGPSRFDQYLDFREPVATIPSHRWLAIARGEAEGVLEAGIDIDAERMTQRILGLVGHAPRSPFAGELALAAADSYTRLIAPSIENEVRGDLKERSDRAAVEVFAQNLRSLLLAAPLGTKRVLGVDPGLRTGCKCAAVDATGRYLATLTLYLVAGGDAEVRAAQQLLELVRKHSPDAIAVGNGTGGREAEAFVRKTLAAAGLRALPVVLVSESGASVYSASDTAREEFPDLDLTVRGAISIARRLQDPLAELVKVEPKAIGVGQYQHDVHQPLLGRKLGEVVESCVNRVGVELNTASAALLGYVAGIGPKLALSIVQRRDEAGPFPSRHALREVKGLGPKTFEQAAGFLRVRGGHPLDASAVHPERYALVERMAKDLGVPVAGLVGNAALVRRIEVAKYVGADVGEPTLRDILLELEKPGRDPRATFEPPAFREDVTTMEDLKIGMELEGVVTNVTAFGAFVDVGVHQDGLVHLSQLSDRFVKDPNEVVKAGDRIKVRVLEVDHERKRISLTAKSGAVTAARVPQPTKPATRRDPPPPPTSGPLRHNPFADLKKR